MTAIQTPEGADLSPLDIGRPVEWMLNPVTRELVGVTYSFALSGERRSVWYTANKRKPKACLTVTSLLELQALRPQPVICAEEMDGNG
ncbi:hypothetical protein [Stagnihabitans tardus]|uniref:Uncharacterized protein n=1 Tax=Stagnihabitans tardus TaxID=2699202 RepID=A0AAE5BWV6_9RHOB|nr:hypothetical protein [Stagnihabitans tardus]NBZ89194.1 hypothetical protein [Stagnihabitans tardus]